MKTLASILAAAAFMLVLAAPALAQGGTTQQSDTVTKTFKLTLYGNVPAERVFEVKYLTEDEAKAGADPKAIQFCGGVQDPGASRIISREACTGNGTVYTADVEFKRGTKVGFMYFTLLASNPGGTEEVFFSSIKGPGAPGGPEDFETLTRDVVNSAKYHVGGQQTPRMPDTGAGGMATAAVPGYSGMSALLLAAAGYALRRRR